MYGPALDLTAPGLAVRAGVGSDFLSGATSQISEVAASHPRRGKASGRRGRGRRLPVLPCP